jgi:hypothetical protein
MWVKTRFLRAFALGLGLSACSASQETPPSVSTSAPAASSPPAAVSALPMASASAAAPVEAAAPLPIATKTAPPVGRPASGAELARFHAALAELAAGGADVPRAHRVAR